MISASTWGGTTYGTLAGHYNLMVVVMPPVTPKRVREVLRGLRG
jgi:hypothetical protein